MYLALSICVLLVSLMELVTGAQFLSTASIPLFSPIAATSATVIVPFRSTYASL